MPSRLSKVFSRSDKKKEAEAEVNSIHSSNSSSDAAPPSYSEVSPDFDGENAIQPPDLTSGFSNLSLERAGEDGLPTPVSQPFPLSSTTLTQSKDQCTAHLKTLECFYRLRQTIGSSDGLFGIDNKAVHDSGLEDGPHVPELLAKLAEKRWLIYVTRAVDRFDAWYRAITPNAKMATREVLDFDKEHRTDVSPVELLKTIRPLEFTKDNIPAVDVLMVWHSYMLNPRAYLEDCFRTGRMDLWVTPMPWAAVAASIHSDNFSFEASEAAARNFEAMTGLPLNSLSDFNDRKVCCPNCRTTSTVPWTKCQDYKWPPPFSSPDALKLFIDRKLSEGGGYCDPDFKFQCQCRVNITHDLLTADKFCEDIRSLLVSDTPMRGTVLGLDGLPLMLTSKADRLASEAMQTPNNLFANGLGNKILKQGFAVGGISSVDDIRERLQLAMKDRVHMIVVGAARPSRSARIGIRRMMGRYWNNSSPFALDLVGAVIRQGAFVEKMHNIDWLHSPALPSTMRRLLLKYSRFVQIMADKYHMAVPTLDVDLAWHTHQLNPTQYFDYVVKYTKQFIDHDDKVAESVLNDAFEWTSKTYQRLYKEQYSECQCWYCEAVRESHTSAASRLFKTSSAQLAENLHPVDQDPRKSVHISAHNAVRPTGETKSYDKSAASKAAKLDQQYEKACARARKQGKKPPKRDDYYYSDAWGYPVYIPAYSPYVGYMPYCPFYYPVTPGCMALGAGTSGNCCSGTCGGGGGGSGGCAGGAMGGCGGSGAGGCGGGGKLKVRYSGYSYADHACRRRRRMWWRRRWRRLWRWRRGLNQRLYDDTTLDKTAARFPTTFTSCMLMMDCSILALRFPCEALHSNLTTVTLDAPNTCRV